MAVHAHAAFEFPNHPFGTDGAIDSQKWASVLQIKAAKDTAEAKALFDVAASEYWETHWRFDTRLPNPLDHLKSGNQSSHKPKHLGNTTADVLIINAVVPLLFCYGKLHKDESMCEMAMLFLEGTEAEDNAIIRNFASCGIKAENAMQTQALLHLYSYFCKRKRCLECRIGNVLLHKTNQIS